MPSVTGQLKPLSFFLDKTRAVLQNESKNNPVSVSGFSVFTFLNKQAQDGSPTANSSRLTKGRLAIYDKQVFLTPFLWKMNNVPCLNISDSH